MRKLCYPAVLATVFLAACWQSRDSQAGDSPELIERLEPVAVWEFDDDSDRVLLDESERYIGLSQGGVSFASRGSSARARDRALSFDGHSGCVVVRHHNDFLLKQGSVTCWIRADDVNRAQGILSKDANGFGDGGHLTISIDQGKIAVRLQSTSDSYEVRAEAGSDRWMHVAFTFGNDGMQLYIDGRLADTSAYPGGLGESNGGRGNHEPLVFGASTMTSQATSEMPLTSFFQGDLDELAIFARQLAASDVAELVSAAAPRYKSLVRAYVANRPTSWWRLDEPRDATVAIDQVGQQHGTYNVVGSSRFDGDDFVDLGALDLDHAFTILAHVNPKSFAVSDARIIAKENGLNEEDQFWSLGTTIRQDRARLRFRLRTNHGTREAVSSERDINVNERVFVAAVYDGEKMLLYQDGDLVGEVAHRGRPATNAHCHVWISDSPSGAGNRPFDGEVRDVSILPAAVSQDQIRAIFQAASVSSPATGPSAPSVAPPSPERLPHPPAGDPAPVEPPANDSNRSAPSMPFVHRCPLCDIRYLDVLIHRVELPGTVALPICEAPVVQSIHP